MTVQLTVHALIFLWGKSDGEKTDQGFDGDALQHTQW